MLKKETRYCKHCQKDTLHTFVFTFVGKGEEPTPWCENAPTCIDGSFKTIRPKVENDAKAQMREHVPEATEEEIEEMWQERIRRSWGLHNWKKAFVAGAEKTFAPQRRAG